MLGPVEFREWKEQLDRISGILMAGEIEKTFQILSLAQWNEQERRDAEREGRAFRQMSTVEQGAYQRMSSQALRCNVARTLTGESFRDFACRLSESMFLQSFCKLDRIDATVGAPSLGSAWRSRSRWRRGFAKARIALLRVSCAGVVSIWRGGLSFGIGLKEVLSLFHCLFGSSHLLNG